MISSTVGVSAEAGEAVSTSYEVFQKHIGFGKENSVFDVSKVFSQECFREWLSTRPGKKVQYPAKSYQRVLYAHIRGADRRRCFPEEVEKQLLKLLRDIDNNPWNDLFVNQKVFFGRRGFRSKGYHESLKQPQENDADKKRHKKNKSTNTIQNDASNNSSPTINALALQTTLSNLETAYLQKTLRDAPRNTITPWQLMLDQLQKYVPPAQQGLCVVTAIKRKVNLWSPAIQYFLDQMIDPNDCRLSRKFLHPSLDEQVFRDDRPVAFVIFRQDSIVFKEDPEAIRLFRGSVLGKHWTELFGSLVSLYYSMIEHLPLLYGTGSVWRRDRLKRNDDSQMVCLFKMVRVGTLSFMYFQEHTDLFPGIANNNYFI